MSIFDLFTLKKQPKITSIKEPNSSIYEIQLSALDGNSNIDLSEFKGKKILFVNVASKCGYTHQYEGLQKLFEQEKERLIIIGLPCNQFAYQENGSADDIQTFCSINYGVSFPISEKIKVKGNEQHPLYEWLTSKKLNGTVNSKVKWNFQKYLVNENGSLQAIFSTKTPPLDKELVDAIRS